MNITELITSRHESTEPQNKIIKCLERHNGKPLTKRHIDQLKVEVDPTIRLSKQYDMSHIEWGPFGNVGKSLLIDNAIKHVKVDTADIVKRNPAYFDALIARNKQRLSILERPERITQLETQIKLFLKAKEELTDMLEHGGDFTADRHTIEETFGLDEGI